MKRLVITGLPCPPEAWESFLGKRADQRILSAFEIFENTSSSDPRELAHYVQEQIELEAPASIVCHDLGVPLTIMSLLRLRRQGKKMNTRLTLFNGAFRKIDILKAPHPIRIQFTPIQRLVHELQSHGGVIDPRLKKHVSRMRAMFRFVMLFGITEKVSSFLGLDEFFGLPSRFPLRIPIQMIVSPNDPYIPWEAIEQLKIDCSAQRFYSIEYGHFPYTIASVPIVKHIQEFESLDRLAVPVHSPRRHKSVRRPSHRPSLSPDLVPGF